jgi:hypothetical protein
MFASGRRQPCSSMVGANCCDLVGMAVVAVVIPGLCRPRQAVHLLPVVGRREGLLLRKIATRLMGRGEVAYAVVNGSDTTAQNADAHPKGSALISHWKGIDWRVVPMTCGGIGLEAKW